ncbi:Hypothetical protein PHPALM_1464 [Phytophthora palmivora]|uniref:Gag protein n=1 Tax=Phytophthora palmivora TaxID=4796 RepID=A0A2P4YS95_9STRA|nr:Hypothetical protein PHPALM_1464 [Phytophthora palmivora]
MVGIFGGDALRSLAAATPAEQVERIEAFGTYERGLIAHPAAKPSTISPADTSIEGTDAGAGNSGGLPGISDVPSHENCGFNVGDGDDNDNSSEKDNAKGDDSVAVDAEAGDVPDTPQRSSDDNQSRGDNIPPAKDTSRNSLGAAHPIGGLITPDQSFKLAMSGILPKEAGNPADGNKKTLYRYAPDHPLSKALPPPRMEPTDTPVDGAHADASGGAEDSALSVVAPSPSSMPPPPPLSALPVPPSTNMALVDTEKTNADDEMLPPPPTSVDPEAVQARPSAVTGGETIRRDNAEVDAARRRVETPKPLAVDIGMIERQYAAGGDWSDIAFCIHQSRPYELPRAKYDMVIETGKTFTKTPLTKITATLVGKSYRNCALDRL